MRFRACRRLIAAMTAVLITVSAVAHQAMAAGMSGGPGMAMAVEASEMASHDMAAPCPMSSDCAKDMSMHAMACFAHCATVVGVLAEPILVPVTAIADPMDLPLARPLASLHGPPESPPPKPSILV
jgi:hypothetical protein